MTNSETRYTIRLARAEELEYLREIEFASGALFAEVGLHEVAESDSLPLDVLQDQQRAGLVWVAADAGDLAVGFAAASEMGNTIYLEQISVHPAHGRRGIGRLLIETLCDWAVANSYQAVTLLTFRDVSWNAPFYSRLGFRPLDINDLHPAIKKWVEEDLKAWAPLERVYMQRDLQH
ncbi:MAG: GNAT family N-acetyltransferase [Acidobacteriota bacterium]